MRLRLRGNSSQPVTVTSPTSKEQGLTEGLTKLGYGVIGLGAKGRVVTVNALAESFCASGLRIRNGGLFTATAASQKALNDLISATLALTDKVTIATPPAIALPRPDGLPPLVAFGIPVPVQRGDIGELLGDRVKAFLIVVEPGRRRVEEKLLKEMFDLTPAEARAAASIASGLTIADAALHLGITEGTLRLQLKHAFKKVGVSRQVELVLLLAPLLHPAPIEGAGSAGA